MKRSRAIAPRDFNKLYNQLEAQPKEKTFEDHKTTIPYLGTVLLFSIFLLFFLGKRSQMDMIGVKKKEKRKEIVNNLEKLSFKNE